MTIRFNCPNCNELIAFADKYSGKRAHCANCGQKFIIPSDGKEKLKQIKPPKEIAEPIPGFYRALFVENKRLFTNPENITTMVFIVVMVCLKFFVANRNFTLTLTGEAMSIDLPIPIGHVLHVAIWGFLFWYYMEIIYSIAFEHEKLPDVILGGFLGFYSFIWKIIKSVYTFFIILLLAELPCLVAAFISSWMDLEWTVLLYVLFFAGLFVFPIAILTAAVGRDLTMLRPDYFLIPIFRAFRPYIVTAVPFCAAVVLQIYAKQYSGQLSANAVAWYLLLNLAVQVIALISMCSIGLFFRHYSCLLPW
jgi:ribosomal protein S27E